LLPEVESVGVWSSARSLERAQVQLYHVPAVWQVRLRLPGVCDGMIWEVPSGAFLLTGALPEAEL